MKKKPITKDCTLSVYVMFRKNSNLMVEVKIRLTWGRIVTTWVYRHVFWEVSDILFLNLRIIIMVCSDLNQSSQVVLMVKNLPANAGDTRDACSIPRLGRFPGEGHGNPHQYSCLDNPMDRGAWQATVHRVAKSRTRLSDFTHTHTHT